MDIRKFFVTKLSTCANKSPMTTAVTNIPTTPKSSIGEKTLICNQINSADDTSHEILSSSDTDPSSSQPISSSFEPVLSSSQPVSLSSQSERPLDLGVDKPMQPKLFPSAYPKTMFGQVERRFNPAWFNNHDWLEYSKIRDAAFCFPCYKFSHLGCISTHQAESEAAFTHKGYRNWKRGLVKHEKSKAHGTAMALWKDLQHRQLMGQEVSTKVNDEQCERNRYYVRSMMDIIFFLTANELPLRGTQDSAGLQKLGSVLDDTSEPTEPCGLFVKLFQYTLQKDPYLASVYSTIPRNASYTSAQFQNEIIHHLADLVKERIVTELDDNWFTIMCDGTKDVNGIENISIVLRFVDLKGKVRERLLCIADTSKLDAESLTHLLINHLQKNKIRLDRILAQCYDGASVNSGHKGGIQSLLQQRLQRRVPYIHCFNHQLHLVVQYAVSSNETVALYFSICQQLYVFFRRPIIQAKYNGESLKRVLEQRWEGHLSAAVTVGKFLQDILKVLEDCEKGVGEIAVIASGILKRLADPQFLLLSKCMPVLLNKLNVPNKLLQSKSITFLEAADCVNTTKEMIQAMNNEETFEVYWCCVEKETVASVESGHPRSKRQRLISSRLIDNEYDLSRLSTDNSIMQSYPNTERTRAWQTYQNLLNGFLHELNNRFGELQCDIAKSVEATHPASKNFLEKAALQPLADLVGLVLDDVELQLAKKFFSQETGRAEDPRSIQTSPVSEAMPTIRQIIGLARTIGVSTAVCESSFSTLNRVLTPQRRSMLHQRQSDLILISYENALARSVKEDGSLIRRFWESGSRRLQLF